MDFLNIYTFLKFTLFLFLLKIDIKNKNKFKIMIVLFCMVQICSFGCMWRRTKQINFSMFSFLSSTKSALPFFPLKRKRTPPKNFVSLETCKYSSIHIETTKNPPSRQPTTHADQLVHFFPKLLPTMQNKSNQHNMQKYLLL